jgi:hypothetical protein
MRTAARLHQQAAADVLMTLLDYQALLACHFHQPLSAAVIEPRIGGEANRFGLHPSDGDLSLGTPACTVVSTLMRSKSCP